MTKKQLLAALRSATRELKSQHAASAYVKGCPTCDRIRKHETLIRSAA